MYAIEINQARKTYANGFTALHGVSFRVEAGDFFALLGPNGAGKTTLISALAGLSRLSSGSIRIMGHDVRQDAHAARMKVGIVPQELVFDPFFTVRETLRFQSGYFGLHRNDHWIDELLGHLGLADKADTNTRGLSGGMKRRLMVAQALVHRPPVIVLDEPTAGVDVGLRHSLWDFMRRLNAEGHTIVLTTHYLEEAQENCRHIAMLKQGQLAALERTDTLLQRDNGILLVLQLSAPPPDGLPYPTEADGQGTYRFRLNGYGDTAALLTALQQAGIGIQRMQLPETDLEQVFIRLTGQS